MSGRKGEGRFCPPDPPGPPGAIADLRGPQSLPVVRIRDVQLLSAASLKDAIALVVEREPRGVAASGTPVCVYLLGLRVGPGDIAADIPEHVSLLIRRLGLKPAVRPGIVATGSCAVVSTAVAFAPHGRPLNVHTVLVNASYTIPSAEYAVGMVFTFASVLVLKITIPPLPFEMYPNLPVSSITIPWHPLSPSTEPICLPVWQSAVLVRSDHGKPLAPRKD